MKFLKKGYKEKYVIIAILILAVILRIVYFDSSYIFWDESVYLMGAKSLTGQQVGYTELDFRSPLFPILISPFTLLPHYVLLTKIFMLFMNSVLVALVYIFGKQFNKNIGILSAFFIAILPHHLMSSSWIMTDGLTTILLISTLLLYFKGFKQHKNSLIYLGGFFLALAILMKFTNLLLLILLFPLFVLNLKKIKTILKSFLIALLTFLPYLIVNYIYFGNPLYGILKSFGIGNAMLGITGAQPLGLILKIFFDYFGIILSVFIIAGMLLFIKEEIISKKNKEAKKENLFWVYCSFVFLPYYIYIVHEGATPIWWDPQRFLLSSLPFCLLFSTYFIVNLMKNFPNKFKGVILTSLIILILLSWSQQYIRFIQPAISYEDGLRQATKEFGLALKDEPIDNLKCIGNCPPIAYYSNKKLEILYDIKKFELKPGQQGIVFSDKIGDIKTSCTPIKSICEGKWCVYLLKTLDTFN